MNTLGRISNAQQKRLYGSRYLLRMWIAPTFLVLAVTAFYAVENWRGDWLWRHYQQEMEAQGISLERPVGLRWAAGSSKAHRTSYAAALDKARGSIELAEGVLRQVGSGPPRLDFVDLVAWKQTLDMVKSENTNVEAMVELVRSGTRTIEFGNTDAAARAEAAAVVLDAFDEEKAVLEKLRSACRRPELMYPLGYEGNPPIWGPMPRVFAAMILCHDLRIKVSAEFAAGKTAEAWQDIDLMFCLSDSLRREPFLIAGIVSVSCRHSALASIREGLADRRFTEPELRQLEQWLGSVDLVGEIPHFIRHEWSQMLLFMNEWENRRKPGEIVTGSSEGSAGERLRGEALYVALRVMPAGWIQLEKLNYSRLLNEPLTAGLRDSPKRIEPLLLDQACGNVRKQRGDGNNFMALFNHTMFSAVLIPEHSGWFMGSTVAQVTSDQARLACALERYYLKHGSYPEKLEEMVPDYLAKLPLDPLSGLAYGYLRDHDRYKLWSVGWNDKDDGGLPDGERYGTNADWVWRYSGS